MDVSPAKNEGGEDQCLQSVSLSSEHHLHSLFEFKSWHANVRSVDLRRRRRRRILLQRARINMSVASRANVPVFVSVGLGVSRLTS